MQAPRTVGTLTAVTEKGLSQTAWDGMEVHLAPGIEPGDPSIRLRVSDAQGRRRGGRYVRYPTTESETAKAGPAGIRCVGDLMSTLSHALLAAPVNDWGKAGAEMVKGPLNELL